VSPEPALVDQLRAMVHKAERALKATQHHLEEGDYDFASSKAYYATFHMLQAALLTKQLTLRPTSNPSSLADGHV